MVDLEAIQDKEAREKAIRKRLQSNRKKAQKVKEAKEKAEQKEEETLDKATDKTTWKGKKKIPELVTMEGKSSVNAASIVDSRS